MDSRIIVRPPLPEEASAVAAVQNTSWRETYSGLLSEQFYDDAALASRVRMWEQVLADGRQSARVAEAEGELIGVALAGPSVESDPVRAEQLFVLYVRQDWHGSGAGSALLEAVLADRPAQLWVAAENPRARRFYERQGFRADGAEVVDDDAEGLHEIRMVR
ncbi:GNAT family N-acetyltransferase [Nesterenkonia sp. CL21]|uniref:GNAT family N-acetyltransferase n=1 Tax=Nesterenkonia sp. CL21 TaxID=3064894 RepID=UPI00287AE21B|nr:GNAT family N-acetyltransferase [Nesterenkonia sp. CL21]MDS2174262.1 GNAT family N-acetyltransferase [Nesterenkonia sp. CL21]